MTPNAISPTKFGVNTGFAAYGLLANPAVTLYGGVDAFFPGGWPNAMSHYQ